MKLEWKSCFRAATTVFLLFLMVRYWEILMNFLRVGLGAAMPLVIGFAMAYILNILMSFYEGFYFKNSQKTWVIKSRRPICLIASILSLIAIVVIIARLVIPELMQCIQFLIAEIPPAIEHILAIEGIQEHIPASIYDELYAIDWQVYMEKGIAMLTNGLGNTLTTVLSAVSSFFSGIVTFFLAVIFALYFLLGKEQFLSQAARFGHAYIPKKMMGKVNHFLTVLSDSFHRYIVGQCLEAVILGALCIVGMLIFRFPYAGMIGALIGFTALIPVAGAYIGGAVGFVMILTESPVKALLFLVFLVVLQQLEGNLIYPKVVGGSLGLPAIWVLAAVTIGGGIMGIFGMLIGVPIAATIYRLVKEDVAKKVPASTEQQQ